MALSVRTPPTGQRVGVSNSRHVDTSVNIPWAGNFDLLYNISSSVNVTQIFQSLLYKVQVYLLRQYSAINGVQSIAEMLLTLLQQTLICQMCACPFHKNIARMSRCHFQGISMYAMCRGWRDSTDLHPACGVDGSIDRFCPKAGLTSLNGLLPAEPWVPFQETQFFSCKALRRPLRYREE